MAYSLDEIKYDLQKKSAKEFYTKHIIRSENWYFEKMLSTKPEDQIRLSDDAKLIISESFGISFNSVMMVGSGKIGYSLSPYKLLEPFNTDENIRNLSDLDFAIISNDLFSIYWHLFRISYQRQYESTYKHIYQDLYRGYINEKNILTVKGCRKEWSSFTSTSNKKLLSQMYIKNQISYRIYRSWEDFEDYNLQNIDKIKKEL